MMPQLVEALLLSLASFALGMLAAYIVAMRRAKRW